MNERTYTAADVRRVRAERECGIDEAKHILDAEQLEALVLAGDEPFSAPLGKADVIRRVTSATDLHDIKVILVDIIRTAR